MNEFIFTVKTNKNEIAVNDYLKSVGVSKEIIKKVKFGGVFLNGKTLLNITSFAKNGDEIKIVLPIKQPNR